VLYRQVAEGIAGRQWSAYLQILWAGTPLAGRATSVGMNAGVVAHTGKDFQTRDPRFMTMPLGDQRNIIAWAMSCAEMLREEHLRCLDLVLLTIDRILEAALR
jgi:hypothetical protein